MRTPLVSLFALLSVQTALGADAEFSRADLDFFESRIRPLLSRACYECHSARSKQIKGGFRLDDRQALLKGGNSGPAVLPGKPEESLLLVAVQHTDPDLTMPPKKAQLSDAEINDLARWVKLGAPMTSAKEPAAGWAMSDKAQTHWAFQPVRNPPVPNVKAIDRVANPIDSFVLARLEKAGMSLSPPADKQTLIRRAYFDLIGLPPTPQQVAAFVNDSSKEAFAKVVDGLLDSPHYGERWGRHWLDTARYSDTKGQVKVKYTDETYPFAWTYRDYVIRAFNNDKPYNQFILEQIAADKMQLKDRRDLAALGFLTLGERFMNNKNDIIDDRIDVVTKGFMGLTVSCARCHDHKFDPIPTADYYSLHGIFASSVEPDDLPFLSVVDPNSPDAKEFKARVAPLLARIDEASKVLNAPKREQRKSGKTLDKNAKKALNKKRADLQREVSAMEMTHAGGPSRAHVLVDAERPKDSNILVQGDPERPGATAPRRFLELFSHGERKPFTYGSGRLELAHAVASRGNPMTARALINRLWLHHFGEGIVSTPDDLGTQSPPPSHPELLDWLATDFMDHQWSIKRMHRLILLSSAWRQSSLLNPRMADKDPANQLLWRQNVRRLEFEPLRDSILALGGALDPTVHGHPVNLSTPRRTIYGFVDRQNLDDVLTQFDFANPDFTSGKRSETTMPLQSLFLMNSPLVVEQAKGVVSLPEFLAIETDAARVQFLFERIYQRSPTSDETSVALRFIRENTPRETALMASANDSDTTAKGKNRKGRKGAKTKKKGVKGNPILAALNSGLKEGAFRQRAPLTTWQQYAHALFMSNEMFYIN